MGNLMDKIKNTAAKTAGLAIKVANTVKFFLTPIGHVIGWFIIILALIVVVYVASEVVHDAIGIWFDDDYAGIATTEDYDTIVAELGYTGYDSFVPEEKWQEYAAYEYAILMDVAEHIYEYQDYVYEVTSRRRKICDVSSFPRR